MTTDELMTVTESLFTELRELRKTVEAQREDMATAYAWLCLMAERHGMPSPGWSNATEPVIETLHYEIT